MAPIKFLSINTDASFHQQTMLGGWAFVILGEGVRIIKKGKFKSCPESAIDAEIKCIINAITDLLNKDLPVIQHILINTDCEPIIKGLNKSKKYSMELLRESISKLKEKTYCTNLQFQHIKAHTQNKAKYSVINKYVDKFAREMMRSQVNRSLLGN